MKFQSAYLIHKTLKHIYLLDIKLSKDHKNTDIFALDDQLQAMHNYSIFVYTFLASSLRGTFSVHVGNIVDMVTPNNAKLSKIRLNKYHLCVKDDLVF